MDALKSWGITICMAALAAGIAGIISPNGKMEKVFKFALSLFILCCLLIPLFNINNIKLENIQFKTTSFQINSELTKTMETEQKMMAEKNIAQLIFDCCKSCGVTPISIKVSLKKNSDNAYAVNSAEVSVNSSDMIKKEKLKETVMKRLGVDIKIKEGGK
ncbi:hypothetical protein CCDG5_1046 [[Clostridium] cellulosi]|jgi:Stage III sporulation protein AF (Spore_III_AF).|uniref:Stage III sporulation protein AF n=1 Tax=[Clostridium] cellulosi TaxID=29343 RepID=A0A078KNW7_9FIRM|nr:MAG: hypothetical protein DIU81_03990 [[Clostridium] cellulosi]CDZ24163.1 hypothetical protein CCDG5_1046 [[Clostridium] cellulosi]